MEAYKIAPQDRAPESFRCLAEFYALRKMLSVAKTQKEFFTVWVESKGEHPTIAEQALAQLSDEKFKPNL